MFADDDIAQAFVGRAIFVGGGRGGGEPALVDAAAVQAERVKVIGMQLEALAGLEKGARHPARGESQKTAGFCKCGFNQGLNVGFDCLEGSDRIHACACFNSNPRNAK